MVEGCFVSWCFRRPQLPGMRKPPRFLAGGFYKVIIRVGQCDFSSCSFLELLAATKLIPGALFNDDMRGGFVDARIAGCYQVQQYTIMPLKSAFGWEVSSTPKSWKRYQKIILDTSRTFKQLILGRPNLPGPPRKLCLVAFWCPSSTVFWTVVF